MRKQKATKDKAKSTKTADKSTQGKPDQFVDEALSNWQQLHDDLVNEGKRIVQLWHSAERTQGQADAGAVFLLLRAHENSFFVSSKPDEDDAVDLSAWHKVMTRDKRGKVHATILHDLFGIEKPQQGDTQRLQRVKHCVPALLMCGGSNVVRMSETGQLLLSSDVPFFRKVHKGEVQGFIAVSVASLDDGARRYLEDKGEIAKRGGTPGGYTKDSAKALDRVRPLDIAKYITRKLASRTLDSLGKPERATYQKLLIELLTVFAAEGDDLHLNLKQVQKLYQPRQDKRDAS